MKEHIHVEDITKIQLHIYVLGYYPMGESVLVIVWDAAKSQTLKSVMFDCYEQNGVNQMETLLTNYQIDQRKLDFVIWTHPDKDHSVGLKNIIRKYTDKNTLVMLPDGATRRLFDFSYLGSFGNWFKIFKEGVLNKLAIVRVSTNKYTENPVVYGSTVFEDGINDALHFRIEILTPFSELSFKSTEMKKCLKGNDISISAFLRFGDFNYFFGGDAENTALSMIDNDKWVNIAFIKIPHHASKSAERLPDYIEENWNEESSCKSIAVSTSFVSGNAVLPENEVLNKYKPISHSILITEDEHHQNNYGIWGSFFSKNALQIKQLYKQGDATIWHRMVEG